EIERAIAALEAKTGLAPTDEQIAKKVGITVEELEESLTDISRSSIAALDELWTVSDGGDQIALIDTVEDSEAPDPQNALSQTEMKEAMADAIARLPEREKLVVTLYYYEELTLREIGEVLGVTESRVSQLHTKAILRLKARLSGSPARAGLETQPPVLGFSLPIDYRRASRRVSSHRAGQDPQHRRCRPPWGREDLARRGAA